MLLTAGGQELARDWPSWGRQHPVLADTLAVSAKNERCLSMNNAQRVTQLHRAQDYEERTADVVVCQGVHVSHRVAAPTPVAVSRSSYLNEKDRHYRAAETVENGGDLAERSVDRVLRLDAMLREAEADGASPMALSAIERLEGILGQSVGMLVHSFVNSPLLLCQAARTRCSDWSVRRA
jgi:hypothetical protein